MWKVKGTEVSVGNASANGDGKAVEGSARDNIYRQKSLFGENAHEECLHVMQQILWWVGRWDKGKPDASWVFALICKWSNYAVRFLMTSATPFSFLLRQPSRHSTAVIFLIDHSVLGVLKIVWVGIC